MFGVTTSDDYRPVAWMGRFPVDVTTILVGIHVALAIVACLLVAAGGGGLLDLMMFDSARVLGSGQVWRLATYAFIHSPMQLLWFAIEMYMLFVFGREVEKFIGQRAYIVLYAVLLFTPSLLLTLWGIQPTDWTGGLARIAFRSFCRLCDHLSIGRAAFADYGEMDGSDSGRDLHLAIAGLPFLDGPCSRLDEYRCRLLFCSPPWGRTGVNLVGEF